MNYNYPLNGHCQGELISGDKIKQPSSGTPLSVLVAMYAVRAFGPDRECRRIVQIINSPTRPRPISRSFYQTPSHGVKNAVTPGALHRQAVPLFGTKVAIDDWPRCAVLTEAVSNIGHTPAFAWRYKTYRFIVGKKSGADAGGERKIQVLQY